MNKTENFARDALIESINAGDIKAAQFILNRLTAIGCEIIVKEKSE